MARRPTMVLGAVFAVAVLALGIAGCGGDAAAAGYNERARPFVWTKPAADVLAMATKPITTSGVEH